MTQLPREAQKVGDTQTN